MKAGALAFLKFHLLGFERVLGIESGLARGFGALKAGASFCHGILDVYQRLLLGLFESQRHLLAGRLLDPMTVPRDAVAEWNGHRHAVGVIGIIRAANLRER